MKFSQVKYYNISLVQKFMSLWISHTMVKQDSKEEVNDESLSRDIHFIISLMVIITYTQNKIICMSLEFRCKHGIVD